MASIGEDIKSVFTDLGTSFIIVRDSENIAGEKLDYEANSQMTKPFIRGHFLEVTFQYDSDVVEGDIIQFVKDSRYFLVMNATPDLFEDEIIAKAGVLYMCNSVGSFYRPSGEVNENYQTKTHWNIFRQNGHCLLTDRLYATQLEEKEHPFIQMPLEGLVLYVPASWDIRQGDRYVVSGEVVYYEPEIPSVVQYVVKSKETHNFPGVEVLQLEEDHRE